MEGQVAHSFKVMEKLLISSALHLVDEWAYQVSAMAGGGSA